MTMTAPACPTASLAKPINNGNTVPPKSPMIIKPDTSFCLSGTDNRASENAMEKILEFPYPTNAMAV